jgi:hypothetical protein
MSAIDNLLEWAWYELHNGNPVKARLINGVCYRMMNRKRAFNRLKLVKGGMKI